MPSWYPAVTQMMLRLRRPNMTIDWSKFAGNVKSQSYEPTADADTEEEMS